MYFIMFYVSVFKSTHFLADSLWSIALTMNLLLYITLQTATSIRRVKIQHLSRESPLSHSVLLILFSFFVLFWFLFFFFHLDVPSKLNTPCQKLMMKMDCCRGACRTDWGRAMSSQTPLSPHWPAHCVSKRSSSARSTASLASLLLFHWLI